MVSRRRRIPKLAPAIVFALVMSCFNRRIPPLYRRDQKAGFRTVVGRLIGDAIGAPIAYAIPTAPRRATAFNSSSERSSSGLCGIDRRSPCRGCRPLLRSLLPHRVLVLGTGSGSTVVEASLDAADAPGIQLVGFYALEKQPENVVASGTRPSARRLDGENVPAARHQRNHRGGEGATWRVLSLRSLLECRLNGVQVTDLARFFERVHGRIPIDSLKASWLIYGQGFPAGLATYPS